MRINDLTEYQKARETKAFRSWFGDSKVVDSNGNPLVVYRGVQRRPKASGFVMTQGRAVPSFTDDPAAASVYARQRDTREYGSGSTVVAAYLRMVKPLDLTNDGETITLFELISKLPHDLGVSHGGGKLLGYQDISNMIFELDELINNTAAYYNINNIRDDSGHRIDSFEDLAYQIDNWGEEEQIDEIEWALDNTTIDTYTIADSEAIVYKLYQLGYDGVILTDVFTGGASSYEPQGRELEMGKGGEAVIRTYRPFHQNQIKSVYNIGTYNIDEPDITKEYVEKKVKVTDTPEFKNWFKNSKIVDARGNPLVCYHGTDRDFSIFQKGKKLRNYPKFNTAQKHLGHFFTDDPSYAERYAGRGFDKENAIIMPVYLSIQNPKIEPISKIDEIESNWSMQDGMRYKRELISQGYDGIIFQGKAKIGDIREIVAFDNTQIKSLYNLGKFDSQAADITKEDKPKFSILQSLKQVEEGRDENLKGWFGNSKVVDSNGLPMILYHGTGADFQSFENLYHDLGIHFGTREAANEFAKDRGGGRVIPVYLKITKPLMMPDIFGPDEDHMQSVMKFFARNKIINMTKYNDLVDINQRLSQDFDIPYSMVKAEIYSELISALFDAGYDGIVYRNRNEGARNLRPDERIKFEIENNRGNYYAYLPGRIASDKPIGKGKTPEDAERRAYDYLKYEEEYLDNSYIVFNPTQVKSIYATQYDPKDPRYTKEEKRNPKYLSGTDKVSNISPVLGAKPKKQKELMNKFFGSS